MTRQEAINATACPTCASQPGEACRKGPIPQWEYLAEVHAERRIQAAMVLHLSGGLTITDEMFDHAAREAVREVAG